MAVPVQELPQLSVYATPQRCSASVITAHCVTFANPNRGAVIRSHTVPRRGEAVASVTYTSGNIVYCVLVFIITRCSRDYVTVDFTVREGCQCITVFDILREKKEKTIVLPGSQLPQSQSHMALAIKLHQRALNNNICRHKSNKHNCQAHCCPGPCTNQFSQCCHTNRCNWCRHQKENTSYNPSQLFAKCCTCSNNL